ncbi:ALF repeat-containing protein [Streptomyces avicenniae]|uniref:ALF repeat-containing protein n=1 Tax=Streptomyces avicenniae TaxID=500153 RepID=UPI0006993AA8|nr:ALF repeat-containing protein [Streptomyces avicenniae]
MRSTRAALLVAATALTPAFLFTTPALAAGSAETPTTVTIASDTPVDEMTEAELRAAIADILATHGGKRVVREANEALNGTVENMRAFLTIGFQRALFEDDLVAIGTICRIWERSLDERGVGLVI